MAYSPTPQQLNLLRFIKGYQLAHGCSPCLQEMKEGIGRLAKSTAHRLVSGLEERGVIRRFPGRERSIEVLADIAVPRAPDGAPLYAVQGDW